MLTKPDLEQAFHVYIPHLETIRTTKLYIGRCFTSSLRCRISVQRSRTSMERRTALAT